MLPLAATFTGPAWADCLPLRWQAVQDVQDVRLAAVHNADVIRNCIGLDDVRAEIRDDEPQNQDIVRIEHKLNALFDMVGMLLAESLSLPAPVDCVIQREGLQWRCAHDIPTHGQLLRVSLYLNRRYLRPLELAARVERVTDDRPACVVARFVEVDDALGDGLAKIIFREHRRGVAQARKHSGRA